MKQDEFIERIRAMPETFADRVAEPNLEVLRAQALAGEWRLAIGHLIGCLRVLDRAVTRDERDELSALLAHLGLPPDGYLTDLRVS